MNEPAQDEAAPIRQLKKSHRRVLGVLVEKAYTTPDAYPLTLKALTSGCNQKSNRDPVTNYSEDEVERALDGLRELGLVAQVHTESGRTERYRHYMRHRFTFSEPQLAVMTELLLRGRQQLGELRARASRMVPIDTQDQLREALSDLLEQGYLQAGGSLDRRGVEVDHNMYPPDEGMTLTAGAAPHESALRSPAPTSAGASDARLEVLESAVEELCGENRELRSGLESLQADMERLAERFEALRHDLGG